MLVPAGSIRHLHRMGILENGPGLRLATFLADLTQNGHPFPQGKNRRVSCSVLSNRGQGAQRFNMCLKELFQTIPNLTGNAKLRGTLAAFWFGR